MANISLSNFGNISQDPLTLEEILIVFNNPINEEQAWAVCHQCAVYFSTETSRRTYRELYTHGIRSVRVKKDGDVVIEVLDIVRGKGPQVKRKNSVTGKDIKVVTESDAIQALGVVIYHALDYGLQESEERHLSRDLEHLLELMINPDEDDDEEFQNADDEGIEKDAKESCTFTDIITLCARHLSNELNVAQHYKAVCKALVAEAEELITFLDKISTGEKQLKKVAINEDEDKSGLDDLQRSDWARLWVQIMRELRRGVRLKAVDHTHLTSTEYELTPFEILLEDIRTRRYSLNKVMVNGDIAPKVKKDAHAVILDFIRSRPPLHPAKKRVLKAPPKIELEPREKLLIDIRSLRTQPLKLRPIRDGKLFVETSRTKLDTEDETETPQPARRLIKPDFNLFLDSFEESETDNDSSLGSSRSSITSPSPERDNTRWRRAVVRDVTTSDRNSSVTRRHSIMVCETPKVHKGSEYGKCSMQDEQQLQTKSSSEIQPDQSSIHNQNESRNKLRRSTPVSRTRACINEIRQRRQSQPLPLHGIQEDESVHVSACDVPSIVEEDNDYVFDRSQGLRMPVLRSHFQQTIKRSASASATVKSSSTHSSCSNMKDLSSSTESESLNSVQSIPKSRSTNDVKEKPRPMVRACSAAEIKPSVLVRARQSGRDNDKQESNTRPRPKPAPRTSINKSPQLSRTNEFKEHLPKQASTSESQKISNEDSIDKISERLDWKSSTEHQNSRSSMNRLHSEKSARWRKEIREIKAGDSLQADKISDSLHKHSCGSSHKSSDQQQSRILNRENSGKSQSSESTSQIHGGSALRRHRESRCREGSSHRRKESRTSSEQKFTGEQSLGQPELSRQPLSPVTRISSQDSISSDSSQSTHSLQFVQLSRTPSQESMSSDTDDPSQSLQFVRRRNRPPVVSRSQSHKNFYRHSTDFSGTSAIMLNNGDSSHPKTRSIMLGRHRKEAEELIKPIHNDKADLTSVQQENEENDQESECSKLSELNVTDLLNVSVGGPRLFEDESTNGVVAPTSTPCTDSDSAKWTHPIECLSLTLEEVTHIRQVLTKAELETLITNHEIYNLVSKGKLCFTCKLVKFSMFGQWGTRCKICKRNVCNNCLRKMNIPTEHFQTIPVHTLSPIPLSQETLDILKVYESTGSVPPTPAIERKPQQNLDSVSPTKRKSLQRSHTIGTGSGPSTLPNKNLLKGPQMSVCCDCKSMIMEIIRTSRTSIALINQGKSVAAPSSPSEESSGLNLSSLSLNVKQFFNK